MDLAALAMELRRDEGVRLKPYKDSVGKLTIGVGRNLDDNGISQAECDLMLQNDIADHCAELDRKLPWWKGLDEVRQRVLANMAFNMGVAKLLGFKNTLALVESGDYAKAADEMLNSAWAKQVGLRATRLSGMMRTGSV